MKNGWLKILTIMSLGLAAELALGRDFSDSLRTINQQAQNLFLVAGPFAFLISGLMFYISRNMGGSYLVSSLVGTIVGAGASSIFLFFNNVIN